MDLTNVITVARREVGYIEEKGNLTKYGKWFGLDGVAWCGIFVSWCYAKGGVKLPRIGFWRGFAGCQTAAQYFKNHNMLTTNPIAGDIVLYDWQGDKRYDHTGIFLKQIDTNTFAAIEGNTSTANQSNGGSVMIRIRHYKYSVFAHIS